MSNDINKKFDLNIISNQTNNQNQFITGFKNKEIEKHLQKKENILLSLYDFYSKAFAYFNEKVFNSILPNVTFLLQQSKVIKNAVAFFQPNFCGINKANYNLITIIIDYVSSYNIKRTLASLIHEMVHFEAHIKSIKDTSKSGKYHNSNFKYLAEKRGYIITIKTNNGWNLGEPNFALNKIFDEFLTVNPFPYLDFKVFTYEKDNKKAKKTIFNYICPDCGVVVKAKKGVGIICDNCQVKFEMEEEQKDNEDDVSKKIDEILNKLKNKFNF